MLRRFHSPHDPTPRTHLLSNGRYAVMITAAGSGYSRWGDLAVTRWREDVTCDGWGSYVFLRDVNSGDVWSAGYQPSGAEPDSYEVVFSEDRVEIVRRDGSLTTTLEVDGLARGRCRGSPRVDLEPRNPDAGDRADLLRRAGAGRRPLADAAHPAFSKLFVQTEFVRRRRRPAGDATQAVARRAARSGRRISRVVEGESVGGRPVRDRPRAFPRSRARRPDADLGDRRTTALGHRRHRARSDLQPAPPRADCAGCNRSRRVLDAGRAVARARPSTWPTSTTTRPPSSARSRWRGPRPRCSFAISASDPTRRSSSSVSRIACSTPTRRCAPRPTC